ncbi:hypothetical protein Drorol1_Dr00011564, partial [Drosera rotundifolia]
MKLKPQFTKPPNSRNHGTRSHSTTPASTLAVPRSLQSAIESVNHNNLNGALNSVKLEHKIPELSPDLVCSRALSLSLYGFGQSTIRISMMEEKVSIRKRKILLEERVEEIYRRWISRSFFVNRADVCWKMY